MYHYLHDNYFSFLKVRKEIQRCYELVHRLGRGVVYLGSSRVKSDHSHYWQAAELAKEASQSHSNSFCPMPYLMELLI